MSFQASTLSIYVLNANGLVYPGKIAHINSAINTRCPHLFVISEIKTNLKMDGKLPKDAYNIFEGTSIKTDNHHLYKWGIVVGVQKDLQIVQHIALSHSALRQGGRGSESESESVREGKPYERQNQKARGRVELMPVKPMKHL